MRRSIKTSWGRPGLLLGALVVLFAAGACGTASSSSTTTSSAPPTSTSTPPGAGPNTSTTTTAPSHKSTPPGTSTTTTTTTVSPSPTLPAVKGSPNGLGLPGLRSTFLADVAPADKSFNAFSAAIASAVRSGHAPTAATAKEASAARTAASALQSAASLARGLEKTAPKSVASDLARWASQEDLTVRGLLNLADNYGASSFSFPSWGEAFSKTVAILNEDTATLEAALGVQGISTASGPLGI